MSPSRSHLADAERLAAFLRVFPPRSVLVVDEVRLVALARGQREASRAETPGERIENNDAVVAASGGELRPEPAGPARLIDNLTWSAR